MLFFHTNTLWIEGMITPNIFLKISPCFWFSPLWFNTQRPLGEECELTCRENSNEVVILPSNMTVDGVLKEHWRNPHKVKVGLHVCLRPHQSSSLRDALPPTISLGGISRLASTSRLGCPQCKSPACACQRSFKCLSSKHGNASNIFYFWFVSKKTGRWTFLSQSPTKCLKLASEPAGMKINNLGY